MTREVVVAVDVGGTQMKCALVGRGGVLRHRERHPTAGRADLVGAILDVARGLHADNVLFVPVGTGVAAAFVRAGAVFAGGGAAGELGHVVVRPGGPVCGCGARGCVEAVASASAVARRAGVPAPQVVARAAAGDSAAAAVWREAVEALADGLAAAQALLDPDLVVVGGGLSRAGAALLDPLRAALRQRLPFLREPWVVAAALGDEAGCLGAGLLAEGAR